MYQRCVNDRNVFVAVGIADHIGKLDIYYDEFMSWADEFDLSTNEERKMIICKLIKQIRLYKGYQFEIDFDSDYKRFLKEFTMAS